MKHMNTSTELRSDSFQLRSASCSSKHTICETGGISETRQRIRERRGRMTKKFITTKEKAKASDGQYRWRKNGKKQINNMPYPRLYYKCADSNCPGKKHVQQVDDDRVEITYYEDHSCQEIVSSEPNGDGLINNQQSIQVPQMVPNVGLGMEIQQENCHDAHIDDVRFEQLNDYCPYSYGGQDELTNLIQPEQQHYISVPQTVPDWIGFIEQNYELDVDQIQVLSQDVGLGKNIQQDFWPYYSGGPDYWCFSQGVTTTHDDGMDWETTMAHERQVASSGSDEEQYDGMQWGTQNAI